MSTSTDIPASVSIILFIFDYQNLKKIIENKYLYTVLLGAFSLKYVRYVRYMSVIQGYVQLPLVIFNISKVHTVFLFSLQWP